MVIIFFKCLEIISFRFYFLILFWFECRVLNYSLEFIFYVFFIIDLIDVFKKKSIGFLYLWSGSGIDLFLVKFVF